MTRRAGAKPGDRIYVSGTIGDGALGLLALRGRLPRLAAAECDALADRYRLPRPRLRLGQALVGRASAALDVSDGLIGDLGHIADCSEVGAVVERARIPLSAAAAAAVAADPAAWQAVLAGGDDYELLFTASQEIHGIIVKLASDTGTPVTVIGEIVAAGGVPKNVVVRDHDGRDVTPAQAGYRHF
ncbi:MAG: AIR synthase-related protein [Pseudomonadota bacterium]